jgi:hypothetical protein
LCLNQTVAGANPGGEQQYVVYAIDSDGRPLPYFLAVTESRDAAVAEMDRWWLAFYKDEKAKPPEYGGLSMSLVSDYDRWRAP